MNDVFQALADPTRRAILDRLRVEGPLSVKELSSPLPISRQAATKHLDLLSAAGLVRADRVGRERHHSLVAPSLVPVHTWLEPYAAAWDRRLDRLQKHLAQQPETGSET